MIPIETLITVSTSYSCDVIGWTDKLGGEGGREVRRPGRLLCASVRKQTKDVLKRSIYLDPIQQKETL